MRTPPVIGPLVAAVFAADEMPEFNVEKGDTLSALAKARSVNIRDFERFDAKTQKWVAVNVSKPLSIGWTLRVKANAGQPAAASKDSFKPKLQPPPDCVLPCKVHTVARGDSIEKIGRKNGVGFRYILAANPGVDDRKLRPGQALNVPQARKQAMLKSLYTVDQADTAETIETKCGRKIDDIMKFNRVPAISALQAGTILLLPPEGWDTKTIPEKTPFTEQFSFFVCWDKKHRNQLVMVGNEVLGLRIGENISRGGDLRCSAPALQNLGISKTDAQIIAAVSKNEGGFDGVNTGPSDLLSCGFIQWRIGGEDLGALLLKFKILDAAGFQSCFAAYGVDVTPQGYVQLGGQVFFDQDCRAFQNEWMAQIFSRAGQNVNYQKAQALMAVERLGKVREMAGGRVLPDIALALAFDCHVHGGAGAADAALDDVPANLCDGKHNDEIIKRLSEASGRAENIKAAFGTYPP